MPTAQAHLMQGRHCDATLGSRQGNSGICPYASAVTLSCVEYLSRVFVAREILWSLHPCCDDSLPCEHAERWRAPCDWDMASIFRWTRPINKKSSEQAMPSFTLQRATFAMQALMRSDTIFTIMVLTTGRCKARGLLLRDRFIWDVGSDRSAGCVALW